MSFPLMNGAQRLVNIAQKYPSEPVIARALESAATPYARGEACLAHWLMYNALPCDNELASEIIKLLSCTTTSNNKHGTIFHLSGHKRFKSRYRVHTHQNTAETLTTKVEQNGSFAGALSDEARRQRVEWNKTHPSGTSRGGIITKRETCKPFDKRYPNHYAWWKND